MEIQDVTGELVSLDHKLQIMVMSGRYDGQLLDFSQESDDGKTEGARWVISVGRREECDICLNYDPYVSREHAFIYCEGEQWQLEDCESRNGSFLEDDEREVARIKGIIPIEIKQLFRIGRTWMRIEFVE